MKKTLTAIAAAVIAFATALPAHALTYVGTRTIDTGTAQLSITTDGTLGGLTTANVLDWTIQISNGVQSFTLNGPLSGLNSRFRIIDTSFNEPIAANSPLIASATELAFDFGINAALIFQLGPPFDNEPAYCVDGTTFNIACPGLGDREETIFFRPTGTPPQLAAARSGLIVLATANATAVPEPATWAMMIVGFGLAGAAMRRRVRVALTQSISTST